MKLIQLIYVSSSPDPQVSPIELERILQSAVRHNLAQGITGMLLYANGTFIQVLEGEEAAVDETFARVERDPRHTGVFVIDRAPIRDRAFGQWSMGFKRLGQADAVSHPSYAPFFEHGFDLSQIQARPGVALEMLTDFARNSRE